MPVATWATVFGRWLTRGMRWDDRRLGDGLRGLDHLTHHDAYSPSSEVTPCALSDPEMFEIARLRLEFV
eukprot:953630-Prymnesium_polylepis.2